MSIWKKPFDLAALTAMNANTAVSHLGIEFTGFGPDWLRARMPVDHRTKQPFGILHGGASVLLAETLGSVASALTIDQETQICVGLDINANHVRAVREGYVVGEVRPFHLGRSTQVWEIKIADEQERPVCISRLTMSILARKGE